MSIVPGCNSWLLPMITTMSNKDSSARMTGTFIIFILNLFLVVIREKRDLSQCLRLVHHSHRELAVSHRDRAAPAPASLALRGRVRGLKVDMRIALRRRGGPSVLASSINIVHALFVYFSVDCSNNMYDLSRDQQTLYTTGKSVYLPP